MGRKAKCRICKTTLDTTTAYKVVMRDANGKEKTAYYCSSDEYLEDREKKEKAARDYYAVENAITEIFGYKVENNTLHKEWQRWNNLVSNEKIAAYLTENKNYLIEIMKKDFSSEFGKIRYFSTILCNKLIDFNIKAEVKEVEKPKIQVDETLYISTPTTKQKRRRSLEDLEDEF